MKVQFVYIFVTNIMLQKMFASLKLAIYRHFLNSTKFEFRKVLIVLIFQIKIYNKDIRRNIKKILKPLSL